MDELDVSQENNMSRNDPRISINKLGEYLTANPVRRRAIIKTQKNPPDVIVARYRNAWPILDQFFASRDPDTLYNGADHWRGEEPETDWQASDFASTADALEVFVDTIDQLPIEDCEIVPVHNDEHAPLMLAGVRVSIRPDYIIKQTRRGRDYIGAIKFHWTKDEASALRQDGGTYVATGLLQYLMASTPSGYTPDHRLCFSVDVFRKSVWEAPSSFRRLRSHLEVACEEIALRWDSL